MKILKDLREAKNLTQQQVADTLGVSRSTFAKWEISERNPDDAMLIKIADLFEVTTDYLLNRPFAAISFAPNIQTGDPVEAMRVAMEQFLSRPVNRAHVEVLLDAYDRLTCP